MRTDAQHSVPFSIAEPRKELFYRAESAEAASVMLELFHMKPEAGYVDTHIGFQIGEMGVNDINAVFFYYLSESLDLFFDLAFIYRGRSLF